MNLMHYWRDLQGDRTTPDITWLATLTAQLPQSSRVARAANPENEWKTADYLLRQIEFSVRLLIWALGGGKDGDKPSPIMSPADRASHDEAVEDAEQMASVVASVFNLERG